MVNCGDTASTTGTSSTVRMPLTRSVGACAPTGSPNAAAAAAAVPSLSLKISIPKPKSKLVRGKSMESTNTSETDPTCGSSRSFSIASNNTDESSSSQQYHNNRSPNKGSKSLSSSVSRTKLLLAAKSNPPTDATNSCTTPKHDKISLRLNSAIAKMSEDHNNTVSSDKPIRSRHSSNASIVSIDSTGSSSSTTHITSASRIRDAIKQRRASLDSGGEIHVNAKWNTGGSVDQPSNPTTPTQSSSSSSSRHRRKGLLVPTSCLVSIETEALKSINSNKSVVNNKEIELPGLNTNTPKRGVGRYENELLLSNSNNEKKKQQQAHHKSSRPSSFHHNDAEDDIICSAAALSRLNDMAIVDDNEKRNGNTTTTSTRTGSTDTSNNIEIKMDNLLTSSKKYKKIQLTNNNNNNKNNNNDEYVLEGLIGSLNNSKLSPNREKKIIHSNDPSNDSESTNSPTKIKLCISSSQQKGTTSTNTEGDGGGRRKLLKKRIEPKLLTDIQLKSTVNSLLMENGTTKTLTDTSTTQTGDEIPSYSSFVIRHPRKSKSLKSLSSSLKNVTSSPGGVYTNCSDDTSDVDGTGSVCYNTDEEIQFDDDASWYIDEQDRRQQLRRQVAICSMNNNNNNNNNNTNNSTHTCGGSHNNYNSTTNNSQRKLKRLVKQKSKYLSNDSSKSTRSLGSKNNTATTNTNPNGDVEKDNIATTTKKVRSRKAVLRVLSGHQSSLLRNNLQQAADASSSSESSSNNEPQ
jgi:hypothetical protein